MKITKQQMTKIFELCKADPQAAYLEWLQYADPKEQLKDALKNYIKGQTKMACLGGGYVQIPDEESEIIASYCYSGGPLTNEKTAMGLLIFIVKLSFFVVVIGLQYGVPAYIIYKLVRFVTRPFRYSAL